MQATGPDLYRTLGGVVSDISHTDMVVDLLLVGVGGGRLGDVMCVKEDVLLSNDICCSDMGPAGGWSVVLVSVSRSRMFSECGTSLRATLSVSVILARLTSRSLRSL